MVSSRPPQPDAQPRPVDRQALPSSRTLARASAFAVCLATVLILGVVIPAETGRDPIGIGRVLGLAEMGRIKMALAAEATAAPDTSRAVVVSGRAAGETGAPASTAWRDSMTVTLAPDQGIELKLEMRRDSTAYFDWAADSSDVYFHMHGEPPDAPRDFAAHSYAKGISFGERGEIIAVYDGIHGWFWRNRSDKTVRITLRTRGAYATLRHVP